jgi:hypothetical protein
MDIAKAFVPGSSKWWRRPISRNITIGAWVIGKLHISYLDEKPKYCFGLLTENSVYGLVRRFTAEEFEAVAQVALGIDEDVLDVDTTEHIQQRLLASKDRPRPEVV